MKWFFTLGFTKRSILFLLAHSHHYQYQDRGFEKNLQETAFIPKKEQLQLAAHLLCEDLLQLLWGEVAFVKQQVSGLLNTPASQDQQLMGRITGQQGRNLNHRKMERPFIRRRHFIPT